MTIAHSSEIPADHERQSAPVPPPGGKRLDAPLRTMLGLVVLWASLFLIFKAHSLSESYIHLATPTGLPLAGDKEYLQTLDPRDELLMHINMHLRDTLPSQSIINMADSAGFACDKANVQALVKGKTPRTSEFQDTPLYQALHKVINNPQVGFALQERKLLLFKQQLQTAAGTPDGKSTTIDWKADLELSSNRLLVFPTGSSDLFFVARLAHDIATPGQPMNIVQVEVWKSTELVTTAKAALDDKGYAQLRLSTIENFVFSIQRKREPQGDTPGLYELQCYYQSFE